MEQKIVLGKLKCLHCFHIWFPRTQEMPDVCPKCKSYEWDKPKDSKITKKTPSSEPEGKGKRTKERQR